MCCYHNKQSVDSHFLTQKTFNASETGTDTQLSVNGSYNGRIYILLCSGQWDIENNTSSAIYVIRCGFNNNNWEKITINENHVNSNFPLNIRVSSKGTLILQSNASVWNVTVISNKPL